MADLSNNRFQLVPSDPSNWKLDLVKGQENPRIQGWCSSQYNSKVPNYCAKYHMVQIDTSTAFAWILYPSKKRALKIKINVLKAPKGAYQLRFAIPGNPETEIAVRLYGKQEILLSSGRYLDGECAVQQRGCQPKVACGVIRDMNVRISTDKIFSQ